MTTDHKTLPNGMRQLPDVPDFLRITPEERRASWAGRPLTAAVPVVPGTDALRAEQKRVRDAERIAKMKAALERKAEARLGPIDRTGQRWDARRCSWVIDPRLPGGPKMRVDMGDKDFAVMSNQELVRWWNEHVPHALGYKLMSYRTVAKFADHGVAVKRCATLASSLRAARAAAAGSTDGDQVSAAREPSCPPERSGDIGEDVRAPGAVSGDQGAVTAEPAGGDPNQGTTEKSAPASQEADVATKKVKKAKAKKTNGAEPAIRERTVAAKPVSELKTIRDGTDRAKILKLMSGGMTVEEIGKEIGKDLKYMNTALYCLNRDAGVGYEVRANGTVKAIYPGSKGYKDVVVTKSE